jgi:Domain of unknown function (DUF1902)
MKRTFFVKAIWDDEAKVWISDTDIEGLFINAKDLDEFEDVVNEFAGELVLENHWRNEKVPSEVIGSTVPIILWHRPEDTRKAA